MPVRYYIPVKLKKLRFAKFARTPRPQGRTYVSLRLDAEMVAYLKRTPSGISKMVEAALFAQYGHMLNQRPLQSPSTSKAPQTGE